jgi:XamI-like restriction endonuclease
MTVNRDRPDLWKADIVRSVDMYNEWFVRFAPKAFRDSRARATKDVEAALHRTSNLAGLGPETLKANPEVLPILRMSTCPPVARDRLIGLAKVSRNLVKCMEIDRCLPLRMSDKNLLPDLRRIVDTINRMLDVDIFVWLRSGKKPLRVDVERAATVVADRLCGAVADPIVRNAQERRQLAAAEGIDWVWEHRIDDLAKLGL